MGTWSERLASAMEMARQAGKDDLEIERRRRKLSLAAIFGGP